jgi:hypothetical protein
VITDNQRHEQMNLFLLEKEQLTASDRQQLEISPNLICCIIFCLFVAGMWKGLAPRILMIGTLTALQWFIYDSVKVYFRMPRPPPPEMPESLKRKLEEQKQ